MNLLPASRLKNLHCADDNEKALMDSLFILSHSEMQLSSSLLFSDISYIFMACMDYMDPDVCCP